MADIGEEVRGGSEVTGGGQSALLGLAVPADELGLEELGVGGVFEGGGCAVPSACVVLVGVVGWSSPLQLGDPIL